jgi:hypothetical protein
MEIINESNFSDEKLKRVIRFCRPRSVDIKEIIFRNSKKFFYGYFLSDSCRIVVGIGPCTLYPLLVERVKKDRKLGYQSGFWLKSKEEALVYCVAHELKHLSQLDDPAINSGKKKRHKFPEDDADAFALKKLENWRKKKKNESRKTKG